MTIIKQTVFLSKI